MLRVTELAFGLEKQWNNRHRDARLIPWHICLAALIAGIFFGSRNGAGISASLSSLLFAVISALLLISIVFISQIGGAFRRRLILWTTGWLLIWFTLGYWQGIPRIKPLPPENTACTFTGIAESVPPGVTSVDVRLQHWQCGEKAHESSIRVRMPLLGSAELSKNTKFSIRGKFARFERPDVPGMFDAESWARTKGLSGRIKISPNSRPVIIEQSRSFDTQLENARRAAFKKLSAVSPEGILPALVLGTSRDIPEKTRETFGHLGIAHVLAVSGLHFGIIAILVNAVLMVIFGHIPWIMRRFGKKRAAAVLSMPLLILYLFFVGAPISAQRALFMASSCAAARVLCSKPERSRSLAITGIIILTISPMAIFEISFQLSFSAVLGIVWGMDFYERELRFRIIERGLNKRIEKCICTFTSMLIMAVSTSLTTAPFVIAHFGQLPVFGILTNLIVIPYVSFVLMPTAMLAAFFVAADLPGAEYITNIGAISENILVQTAIFFDRHIPLAFVKMVPHPIFIVTSVVTAAALLFRFKFVKWRIIPAAAAILAMSLCIASAKISPRFWTEPDELRITFIDMGQADSTLIEFPDGHVMLIDVGSELGRTPSTTRSNLLPYLKRLGIQRIDTLVITHGDYDHAAGLPELKQHCEIGQIWHNGLEHPEWMKFSGETPIIDVSKTPIEFSSAEIKILWPTADSKDILQENNALTPNESSIVMRLKYKDFSAVFTGDAGIPVETQIAGIIEPSTLLKVGHHGSKSASSQPWIEAVKPVFAIFSAGENNHYHFPHPSVKKRFFTSGAAMFETGDRGAIRFTTDGKYIDIQTMH